jgi:quercetin dioxygenase-like cupin family protein
MPHPVVPTDPGVTRQVLAEGPELMVVAFRFETGAEGALHDHPHVQATYVEAGRFTFFVGEAERELGPGDTLVIPSGA